MARSERLIFARHPHHLAHDRHRLVRRRMRKHGAIEIADPGDERSDSKHADKTLRSSQARRGLATRRVAAPARLLSTPSCGTDGKGIH